MHCAVYTCATRSNCQLISYFSLCKCLAHVWYCYPTLRTLLPWWSATSRWPTYLQLRYDTATNVLGTNLILAFTSFGSSPFILCSGLLVGSVWILRVYSTVPARVPTFSWPTKNREVPHAPEKREARAREEETGMTFHLLTFTVSILLIRLFVCNAVSLCSTRTTLSQSFSLVN